MMDNVQVSWPGWETVRLIGRGSFGAVYEIQRDVFGETEKAALKVISIPQNDSDIEELYNDGYDDESITSTFQSHLRSIVAEYSLMKKMNGHTHIVNCDDMRYVQHDDGIGWDIFIKMELLTPLAKALPAQIEEKAAVKLAKDMCAALELCSKHNVVHRDIKPQNIFVSEHGDYKLGDFGIAKTVEKTMGGTKIGTYKYMAPEVYNNQPYGSSADIYSLGLVLYWMLNERRMPFLPLPPEKLKAGMEEEARERRFRGEQLPPPAHGSEKLKKIVLKACAYDPAQRYHTAAEMLQDLENMSAKAVLPELVAAAALAPKTAPSPAPEQTTVTSFEPMTKAATAEQTGNTCSTFAPMAKAPAPQPQERFYTPLPNDGWRCVCGRENQKHISSCTCGLSRRDLQAAPVAQEVLADGKWYCVCGRINAHYVSNCACGAKKSEIVPDTQGQKTPAQQKEMKNPASVADVAMETCDPERQKTIRKVKTAMFILTGAACLLAMIFWRYMWYIVLRDLLIAWMIPGFVLLSARPKCRYKWENSREKICKAALWAQCVLFIAGAAIALVAVLNQNLSAVSEIILYISPAALRGYWATRYACGESGWAAILYIVYGLICLTKNICAFRIARQLRPKADEQ